MKKLILAAAVVAMSANAAFAEDFGATQGDWSTEIQFNPFSNDFGTFKLDQIKVRYMITDQDALRFGIGFGLDNSKNTPNPESNEEDIWSKNSYGSFSINLGYERHIIQKGRIDLYLGAALGYERTNASQKSQAPYQTGVTNQGDPIYSLYETSVHNAWLDGNGNLYGNHRTSNIFKFNLLTGIDFYVYKGLYVGAEFGISLRATSLPGWYTTEPGTNDNGNFVGSIDSKKKDKGSELSFKTYCEPALRLGWTF